MNRTGPLLLSCLVLLLGAFSYAPQPTAGDPPWREPWSLRTGFEMEIDSRGFNLPTGIAFIPNPGTRPKDPLYFVSELHGRVRVVTNDRTVLTFTNDVIQGGTGDQLKRRDDEFGLAGICLAPEKGYIFVTFTERRDGELYNNIARLESEPGVFGLEPDGVTYFPELFSDFPTGVSHQIGSCDVVGNQLFVGVGDGFDVNDLPLPLESPQGKILRMTLDGAPIEDSPYFDREQPGNPSNYVWASGLRNPFGIQAAGSQLFATDNGIYIDRFIEVSRGTDYLWNGNDLSIASKATAIFPSGFGPAQLDFAPPDYAPFPPEYRSTFYAARSKKGNSGVFGIPFTLGSHELSRVPYHFIGYRGPQKGPFGGVVAAVGIGPDGLYFAPIVPDPSLDKAVVYHVFFAGEEGEPADIQKNPKTLIETYACLGCHSLNGEGSLQAPTLDRSDLIERLSPRLNSSEYVANLEALRESNPQTYGPYEEAHNLVIQADGLEQLRTWLAIRLVDPRFDDPDASMPSLGIGLEEARILAEYLVPDEAAGGGENGFIGQTDSDAAQLVLVFVLGILLGAAAPFAWKKAKNS